MPSLTLSGNEITDATRNTGTEGDGRAAEGSMGVWEATTNLCTNGGFETNTTGWTTDGSNTIERSTEQAKFGSASLKATWVDSAVMARFNITLTAAQHECSIWVYVPSAFDGTGLRFTDGGQFVGATGTQLVDVDLGTRDEWQRLSFDITPDAGDLTGAIMLTETGTDPVASGVVYIDAAQVELQPIATPYVETDGASASRSAASATFPVTLIDETQMWVAARLRSNFATGTPPLANGPYVFAWADDGSNFLHCRYNDSSSRWQFQRQNAGAGAPRIFGDTLAVDDEVTVIAAATSAGVSLSIDGAAFLTTADTNIPTLTDTVCYIGAFNGGSSHGDFDFWWFATGTGTLTDADAARFATAPNVVSHPGGFDFFNQGSAAATMLWTPQGATVAEYVTSGLSTLQPLLGAT